MTTTDHPTLVVTKPSPLELRLTRTFHAPRHLVWAAQTETRHVRRWMLGPPGWAMRVCEHDLRPGGAWHYVWRNDEGAEMEMGGTFVEIVPSERIVRTEQWGGDWPETTNTTLLHDDGEGTTLSTTMLFPSTEARDAVAAGGMTDGAGRSFDLMDDLLADLA